MFALSSSSCTAQEYLLSSQVAQVQIPTFKQRQMSNLSKLLSLSVWYRRGEEYLALLDLWELNEILFVNSANVDYTKQVVALLVGMSNSADTWETAGQFLKI